MLKAAKRLRVLLAALAVVDKSDAVRYNKSAESPQIPLLLGIPVYSSIEGEAV